MEKPRLNERGHEILDPTPMEIPAGFKRPMTTRELIQRIVRTTLSESAGREGNETFEEADDFDTGEEDENLRSPYQLDDEQENAKFIEEKPEEKKEVEKSLPKEAKKQYKKKPQRGTNDTTNEKNVAEETDDQSEVSD